jgi:hypothetical protein
VVVLPIDLSPGIGGLLMTQWRDGSQWRGTDESMANRRNRHDVFLCMWFAVVNLLRIGDLWEKKRGDFCHYAVKFGKTEWHSAMHTISLVVQDFPGFIEIHHIASTKYRETASVYHVFSGTHDPHPRTDMKRWRTRLFPSNWVASKQDSAWTNGDSARCLLVLVNTVVWVKQCHKPRKNVREW